MRWCSGGEKCPADVRHWFLKRQIVVTDTDKLLDYLTENDYINESRYAAAFVHDKFLFNYWGRLKIAAELTKKQIPQSVINQAIESGIDEEEYQNMLQNLLKKKKKMVVEKDISVVKQKIRNFAVSKGFESDLVYQETEKLMKE
ncbi:MAG: RecX family transcriptional regulator [Bacteroidales bacterium]|nr:RecX family transcriptional regulator [Bacteroidales bacterium]